MSNYMKNIFKGFVVVFTFGMVVNSKKTKPNNVSNYWFKTGDYINNAYKVETCK